MGSCLYGSTCHYSHGEDTALKSAPLPILLEIADPMEPPVVAFFSGPMWMCGAGQRNDFDAPEGMFTEGHLLPNGCTRMRALIESECRP